MIRLPQMPLIDSMNAFRFPQFSLAALVALGAVGASAQIPSSATPTVIVSTAAEPVAAGKFEPTWDSLHQYRMPEWFRDAKFGIERCQFIE